MRVVHLRLVRLTCGEAARVVDVEHVAGVAEPAIESRGAAGAGGFAVATLVVGSVEPGPVCVDAGGLGYAEVLIDVVGGGGGVEAGVAEGAVPAPLAPSTARSTNRMRDIGCIWVRHG